MELASYFLGVQYLIAFLFALWLALLHKTARPGVLVAGAIGFSVLIYVASILPLERPYALRPGADRAVNLAMSATAATGHSPFESYQVASADTEPLWRLLMRGASLGRPENVIVLYQILPAVMMILLSLSLYFGLRRCDDDGPERRWELALVVYAVLLLSSSPQDRFGEFQTFWQMMFVFKPNHTLGLVILPVFIGCWSSPRPLVRNVGAGLLLATLAWVFIMHWSYVLLGLLLYPLVARALGSSPELGRLVRVGAISFAGALPYVVYLYYNYWGIHARIEGGVWPGPGPLEGYLNIFSIGYEHGAIFLLSVVGIVAMLKRRRREDVLLLSLLSGSVAGWMLYIVGFAIGKALQAEEFYFYTRFLLSVAAGTGAYWILSRLRHWLDSPPSFRVALLVFLAVSLPQTVAYWWYPPSMDHYYEVSLKPIPEPVTKLCRWAREETPLDAVFVASAHTASWIAALSGRRVLLIGDFRPPRDYHERRALTVRLRDEPESFAEAKDRYQVTHLVIEEESAPSLPKVYQSDRFQVYELR